MLSTKIGIFPSKNPFNTSKERFFDIYAADTTGINSEPMGRKLINISMSDKTAFQDDHKTITPIHLNKLLGQGNVDFVFLDLRSSRHYQNGHIIGARSANCTTRLMSKKTLMDWKRSEVLNENHYLLYDQQSDLPADNSPQMILIEYLLMNNKQVTFLQGGFDEFKKICDINLIETSLSQEKLQSYNYSPTNVYSNNSEDVLNATASQILPFLFIGNERDSSDLDLLKSLKITHILNVTSTSPFYFKNLSKFVYKRLPACDSHMQNLRLLYKDAFKFIDEVRHSDGRILVHCWAGVSRSPSIVIAYLMKHSHLSVLEILKFVQSKRSIVAPNIHFMGQLEKYNLDLNQNLEKRSFDLFNKDLQDDLLN